MENIELDVNTLTYIFSFCKPIDVLRAGVVCRLWKAAADDDYVWVNLFARECDLPIKAHPILKIKKSKEIIYNMCRPKKKGDTPRRAKDIYMNERKKDKSIKTPVFP